MEQLEHIINATNNTTDMDVNSEYVYVILTAVTSCLSIIGGATICVLYISFRDMRTPSRTLLFFLAFSDASLALGNLLGVLWYLYSDSKTIHRSHGYCAFQSAMTIYFSCTSFFWTVIMALNLFHAVVLKNSTFAATYMKLFHLLAWILPVLKNSTFAATYMKLFHLLAWIPPGIIVIVALALDVLGTDTTLEQASWCWIDPRTPHVLLWQFATGKFWEILSYVTVVVLYTSVKITLKKQELKKKTLVGPGSIKRPRKDVLSEANRKLTFVPFVFIVCRIWGTLRFLLGNFAVDHINEPYVTWINPLQGIGDSAQGFANCVLYCLSTDKIRQRLARSICPSRFIPVKTSESMSQSNSRYMNKLRVGVEENNSQSYADISQNQNGLEQSTNTAETCFDQAINDRINKRQPANTQPSSQAMDSTSTLFLTNKVEVEPMACEDDNHCDQASTGNHKRANTSSMEAIPENKIIPEITVNNSKKLDKTDMGSIPIEDSLSDTQIRKRKGSEHIDELFCVTDTKMKSNCFEDKHRSTEQHMDDLFCVTTTNNKYIEEHGSEGITKDKPLESICEGFNGISDIDAIFTVSTARKSNSTS